MGQAVTMCAYLALGDIDTTEEYNSNYLRSLETLTKWADAYAALLVSVTLVVVVQ
jgi:archaellum biogenesis protein FlaJ (TadC family)